MAEPDRKDSEWLKTVLVGLLDDARMADPVDHGACAKYADLLWKILPKGTVADQKATNLDEIRKAVQQAHKPKSKA